jgi:hypothetical protein
MLENNSVANLQNDNEKRVAYQRAIEPIGMFLRTINNTSR